MVPFRPTCSSLISPSAKVTIVTAAKRHALEESGRVLLVAADAIECLGVDEIEAASAGVLHEELNPWPDERRARDGAIAVDLHKLVPVTLAGARGRDGLGHRCLMHFAGRCCTGRK